MKKAIVKFVVVAVVIGGLFGWAWSNKYPSVDAMCQDIAPREYPECVQTMTQCLESYKLCAFVSSK